MMSIFDSTFSYLYEYEGYKNADFVRLLQNPSDLAWLGFTEEKYPNLQEEVQRELEKLTSE